MDATIRNTINYQPTGVYTQFVKNPNLLAQGGAKKDEAPDVAISKNKELISKQTVKSIKKAGILGGLILIGIGAYQYHKGMKAINLKNKLFPDVTPDNYDRWMCKAFSDEQREHYKKVWELGRKYEENIVGSIHNKITSIREWFKKYFYSY